MNESLKNQNKMSKKGFYDVYIGILICFLFLVLPFIINKKLFDEITSSNTIYFLFGLGFILSIVSIDNLFSSIKPKIRLSKIDLSMLTLCAYILINKLLIHSHFDYSLAFYEFSSLFILYILLRYISIKISVFLVLIILVAGIFQSIYGILQFLEFLPSLNRYLATTGSFFNSGPFAGYLVLCYTLLLGIFRYRRMIIGYLDEQTLEYLRRVPKKIITSSFYLLAILLLISISITLSRAAILVAFSITTYHIYKWVMRYSFVFSKKRIILKFSLILISILTAVSTYYLYQLKKASADGRLLIWEVSMGIIRDNPITGIGFDHFKSRYMDYQAKFFDENNVDKGDLADNTIYAFNELIQFIVEEGFVGLIPLTFLGLFIYRLKPREDLLFLQKIVTPVLIAFSLFGFFSYPSKVLPIKLLVFSMLAIMANIDKKKIDIQFDDKIKTPILKPLFLILFILSIHINFNKAPSFHSSFLDWKKARFYSGKKNYELSTQYLEKSYSALQYEGQFLIDYGKNLVHKKEFHRSLAIFELASNYLYTADLVNIQGNVHLYLENFAEAEKYYLLSSNMIPNRFYPIYLLSKLYCKIGERKKAFDMANKLLSMKVKVASITIVQMRKEVKELIIVGGNKNCLCKKLK